jgi:hypothetical protein
MRRQVLTLVLAATLVCGWVGPGAAQEIGYTFRSLEQGFAKAPKPVEPNSLRIMADAAIGRPLGLVTTTLGATFFVLTLPMTAPSGSVGMAARGLVGKPGGWTFCRPLGTPAYEFEDPYVFPR